MSDVYEFTSPDSMPSDASTMDIIHRSTSNLFVIGQNDHMTPHMTYRRHYAQLIYREKYSVVSSLIIILIFIGSYCPLIIAAIISAAAPKSFRISDGAMNLISSIALLNNMLNPYIYSLRSQTFRKGVRSICLSRNRRRIKEVLCSCLET